MPRGTPACLAKVGVTKTDTLPGSQGDWPDPGRAEVGAQSTDSGSGSLCPQSRQATVEGNRQHSNMGGTADFTYSTGAQEHPQVHLGALCKPQNTRFQATKRQQQASDWTEGPSH
jgi:hypothetical protein